MHIHFKQRDLFTASNIRFFCYAACSTFGIVLGILFQTFLERDTVPLFSFSEGKYQFFSAFFSMAFPFFFTVLLLKFSANKLCAFYVFVESVSRGLCGILLIQSFGNASWLARPLLMFSGSVVSVLNFWLIIRHGNNKQVFFLRDVLISFLVLSITSIFNLFVVFPFFSSLFQ